MNFRERGLLYGCHGLFKNYEAEVFKYKPFTADRQDRRKTNDHVLHWEDKISITQEAYVVSRDMQ